MIPSVGRADVQQPSGRGVAHPERHRGIDRNLALLRQRTAIGAHLQGNDDSLTGRYGHPVRAITLRLPEERMLNDLSSNFHGQPGCTLFPVPDSREIRRQGGGKQFDLPGRVNPWQPLEGRPPLPPILRTPPPRAPNDG